MVNPDEFILSTIAYFETPFGLFLRVLIVLILTIIVSRVVHFVLERSFHKSSKRLKIDPTKYNFFRHFISALIYMIGIGVAIYMVPSLRTLSISLFAGAGVLAVIVGFASQQAFSNVVSGIFIVIFKPFRVGDRIRIGTVVSGIVEDITLRHTVIRNFENKRIIIPNTVISSETIENADLAESKVCRFVEFGISYDSNVDKAMSIMQKLAQNHPNCIDNRTAQEKKDGVPQVIVRVLGFTDSAVTLRAWVWANNQGDAFVMGCDLNREIKLAFDKQGIEIPFPHRTIVYKDEKKKRK